MRAISSFTFTLPHRTSDQELQIKRGDLYATGVGCRTSNRQGRILVAEDDAARPILVRRMLSNAAYDVILAHNGEEAVQLYEVNNDIALILMDIQMSKLDGFDATKQIRERETAVQASGRSSVGVPIIALCAVAMKEDHERGMSMGMTDYLTKPVNYKTLVETLEKHLGERVAS